MKIIALLFISSCNFSDSTEKLGEGYFYRNEGEAFKDILSEMSNGGEVPATVFDYAYNSEFIIAKQKPRTPQEPLYGKEYTYPDGFNKIYYWIILKKEGIVLGPLNKSRYAEMRWKCGIPHSLQMKEC